MSKTRPAALHEPLEPRRPHGLAAVSPERRREISAAGGKAAHAKGKAYTFNPEKARQAGSKGGTVAQANGNAYRFTKEKAREAGQKGGLASRQVRQAQESSQTDTSPSTLPDPDASE